jgi:FkbM family methyltransferase
MFEPDKEEYESLLKRIEPQTSVFPYALYKEKDSVILHLTKSRGCSSLYEPKKNFLIRYPEAERFEIEKSVELAAIALDTLYTSKEIADVDFIKIDTQGTELDILAGGANLLKEKALGIEVEVEFNAIYEDQPLFSDVDRFIRDLRKTYWKYKEGIHIGSDKGQLIFDDALYFRPPQEMGNWLQNFDKNDGKNKIMMACLMGVVYGYLDYGLCLLNQPFISNYLDEESVVSAKAFLSYHGRSLKYRNIGAGKISAFLNLLHHFFRPTHKGWVIVGHDLGSRKKAGIFYF